MKRDYAVLKLPMGSGSFVVQAKSPRGAFRVVRNNYADMITNHLSRESYILQCEGIKSDCRGILRINRDDRTR